MILFLNSGAVLLDLTETASLFYIKDPRKTTEFASYIVESTDGMKNTEPLLILKKYKKVFFTILI